MHREGAIGQSEDNNPVPFQALRAVDRQDLDSVRIRLAQRRIQPVLAFLCHVQIRQEGPKGRTRRFLLVCRSDRNELIECRAPTHRQRIRDHVIERAHDENRSLDLLGDGTPHALTNLMQALAQQPHAAHCFLTDRGMSLSRPTGRWRVIDSIQEHGLVRACSLPARQDPSPVTQSHQVGRPQVNACQQTREPRGRFDVVGQLQRGAHVLDGRLIEETAQADDLRGNARLAQRVIDQRKITTLPTEHGYAPALTALSRLRAHPPHEINHRAQGLVVVLREGNVDGS